MRTKGIIYAGSAAVALLAAVNVAHAQNPPADENGRYTLSATDNGYLRLDTRTGAVSICTRKGGWTCRVVPDERAALDQEIGHLQEQVDALKAQLASRDDTVKGKIDEPLAKSDSLNKSDSLKKDAPANPATNSEASKRSADAGTNKDAAVEPRGSSQSKLTVAFDRVWQHLVGIAARVQKKISESI
ncbi:MAG: hypothetical protein J0G33_08740 [Afipia felis]|nr:hypothetical protein [Afipia felis]